MRTLRVWIFLFAVACMMLATAKYVFGAPPDPWIRMVRPTGCSGGVLHASHEYGIWVATAAHCVRRPGRAVDLKFFKDGYTSPTVRGYCLASHPRYDCSIVVVPPGTYNYPEFPSAVPLSASGAYPGETVWAVGSYAGGTVAPAARKVAVTDFRENGYKLRLNNSAWGGHSGGAVVSADSGELVGVLYATLGGYSWVTTSKAIIETLQLVSQRGQAMASIPVETPTETQVSVLRPVIEVSGSVAARSQWYAELLSDPRMSRFDWRDGGSSKRLRFTWKPPTGQGRYIDGWPGYDRFVGRMLKCRGFPQDVPDSVQWGPYGGGGRSPKTPGNPWTIPPNIIGGRVDQRDTEIERLQELVKNLIEEARTTAQLVEDNERRLRLEAEDEARRLRRETEDTERELRELNRFQVAPMTTSPGFDDGDDDHPLNVAADWIQDSRDREKVFVKFVASITPSSPVQPSGQLVPTVQQQPTNGDIPPWVPWGGGAAVLAGSAYLYGRRKPS